MPRLIRITLLAVMLATPTIWATDARAGIIEFCKEVGITHAAEPTTRAPWETISEVAKIDGQTSVDDLLKRMWALFLEYSNKALQDDELWKRSAQRDMNGIWILDLSGFIYGTGYYGEPGCLRRSILTLASGRGGPGFKINDPFWNWPPNHPIFSRMESQAKRTLEVWNELVAEKGRRLDQGRPLRNTRCVGWRNPETGETLACAG